MRFSSTSADVTVFYESNLFVQKTALSHFKPSEASFTGIMCSARVLSKCSWKVQTWILEFWDPRIPGSQKSWDPRIMGFLAGPGVPSWNLSQKLLFRMRLYEKSQKNITSERRLGPKRQPLLQWKCPIWNSERIPRISRIRCHCPLLPSYLPPFGIFQQPFGIFQQPFWIFQQPWGKTHHPRRNWPQTA